jgi:hypothetical protein
MRGARHAEVVIRQLSPSCQVSTQCEATGTLQRPWDAQDRVENYNCRFPLDGLPGSQLTTSMYPLY